METLTRNQKFTNRKFWFPVGVFCLFFLPLMLYQNLHSRSEKVKSYCQEIILTDNDEIKYWHFDKSLKIELDNSNKLSPLQKQYIYDKLGYNKRSYDSILNIVVKIPAHFSYQDFVTFNDSLENFYGFSYKINDSSISIYRNIDMLRSCGTPYVNQYNYKPKETQLNPTFQNFFILGICFPILALANLLKLFKLRKYRNHFPANPYMQTSKIG